MIDKRMQAVAKFFRRIDRLTLLGADGEMLKEQKKERQEKGRVRILEQELDTCPMCGSTASFHKEKNFEYPEGIYAGCNKCGVRTPQFVEFTKPIEGRSSYSYIKSAQVAAESWNNRL